MGKVCRRCNETNLDCDGTSDPQDKCRCEDIQLKDPTKDKGEFFGGWETCDTLGWCFVKYQVNEGPGTCPDQDDEWYSGSDDFSPADKGSRGTKSYIWLNEQDWEGLSQSSEACKGTKKNTGNEPTLEGIRIKGDRLKNVLLDGTLDENELVYYVESSEDCREECNSRPGTCGAWSFDKENLECFMHTVESCCGQFGKRETNPNFISGYVCRDCWSTKAETDCPCGLGKRTEKPGTAHSSGANHPLHQSAVAELSVGITDLKVDPCACEYRRFPRGRKKCRCVKPQCSINNQGSDGKCRDRRRCRNKPLNPVRFPKC